ncbi:hypothetical protein CPB84DRAFT_1674304 [Gymnopilus junonius]|uniref:Phosphate transporter n=1 Tax=Gymnopilus junonius TaxID=109634 RepID=A0A9P5NW94_GYMJU|nr:hypothetical protein CPB84DRAFT_1674304 [Gymnopilus junonius]
MAQELVGAKPEPSPTNQHRSALDDFEKNDGRPAFFLTRAELKLLTIAGVGFFLDGGVAYDLFIINPVTIMLQYRLYGGGNLPANLEGFVKASANIGSVIGQFLFGTWLSVRIDVIRY